MSLNKKTYLDKCNTIIEGAETNTGLNPVTELNYGINVTRFMLHFDHNEIKKLVDDKTYPCIDKLNHRLKMFNSSSIVKDRLLYRDYDNLKVHDKERAASFDIIFFLIPKEWDNGRGFDFYKDYMPNSERAYNENGSNWFNCKTNEKWDNEGIYSNEFLSDEYEKFIKNGKNDIIFAEQHFDYGTENIDIDITEIVNKFITGKVKNNGICIAYKPDIENKPKEINEYVGFFSNKTNSFFEPYIETTYSENINDDRTHFYLDKANKLYFYSFVGGKLTNLDTLPTCIINDAQIAAKQATKGVYYIDITMSSKDYEKDTMFYDTWTNLMIDGRKLNDVTLYFTTETNDNYYNFGLPSKGMFEKEEVMPTLHGIDYGEKIKKGDLRNVVVECRIRYTTKQTFSIDNLKYRLYTLSGNEEIDVISWSLVDRSFCSNYFTINTNDLIPSTYYIDIQYNSRNEIINHYKLIEFEIVNEAI